MWSYQDELIPRKHQVDGTQLLIYIYIQSIYFAILLDVTCLGSLLQYIVRILVQYLIAGIFWGGVGGKIFMDAQICSDSW